MAKGEFEPNLLMQAVVGVAHSFIWLAVVCSLILAAWVMLVVFVAVVGAAVKVAL